MYLLDTNICIFAINHKPEYVIQTIQKNLNAGIYISALTLAELEFGVENSWDIERNRIALLKFISIFNILNFDDADAIAYGKLKSELKKKGQLIGPIDMLLSAQAISKALIFVTNNTSEFSRVSSLIIEDWSFFKK
jgi:tRNA(fMet)-specific endonuclease VapC